MQGKAKALPSDKQARLTNFNNKNKDTKKYLNYIKKQVQNGTGFSIVELKKKYNEESLFYIGLKYVKTTNKAYCLALNIPIQNGCRAKRKFEKMGRLFQSVKQKRCKISNRPAYLITTNKTLAIW